MPGLNVSRIDAEERSRHLEVASYDVTINLIPGSGTFYSKAVIHFSCNSAGYDTFINAVSRKILSATLNDSPVDTSTYDGETLFLKNLSLENELVVEMEAIFSTSGEGLQRSVDPVDKEEYVYTQGAPALTQHWYACFDQPDLKATFALTVNAPAHWEVVANTPVQSRTASDANTATWVFPPTPRLSTYITALTAGPYHHVHDEYAGEKKIPLGIYVRKSLGRYLDSENIFETTKQGFQYFERVFGLAYPFEKYDQIAVIDYNWGAMENVGAVTFREESFIFRSKVTERVIERRSNTILHEMAHMWFGDMVTMRWWDDLWLNESFADWASHMAQAEATKFTKAWTSFNSQRKNWAYRQDQLSSTHPIVVAMADIEAVNANFDGITYSKGASVIQQLVAHVGRDNFINGLQKYFVKYAFKSATLADLLTELEATSGRDLKPWSATWLETAGVNTLRPAIELSRDTYKSVGIIQEIPTVPAESTELRPHRLAVGLYDLNDDTIVLRKSVELDIAGALTDVAGLAGEKIADLLLINDRDMTYAKIRFDARSIETLKQHLGDIQDSLTRSLCWSAAWDMTRDAEISATDFADIARAGLPREDQSTVITIVLDQLSTLTDLYANPSIRDSLREEVASNIGSLLTAAAPGSDQQLLYARAFATLAQTPRQAQRIQGLLEGHLQGLVIDPELRWHFVNSLIERGLLTENQLESELKRDNTTAGQLAYSFGIAAFPTAEAKADAWKIILADDLPNSKKVEVIRGFHRPLQRDLIEPYIDKYFNHLTEIWDEKSFEVATQYVRGMFPIYATTQATLDTANKWLETTGKIAPAALRRLVAESRDNVARALKVQAMQG